MSRRAVAGLLAVVVVAALLVAVAGLGTFVAQMRASDRPRPDPSTTATGVAPAGDHPIVLVERINGLGPTSDDISVRACAALTRQESSREAELSAEQRRQEVLSSNVTFGRGATSAGTMQRCLSDAPLTLAVADLDGDLLPEIVTTRLTGATDVLWNNGGTFSSSPVPQLSTEYELPEQGALWATGGNSAPDGTVIYDLMRSLIVADANADGHPDIILTPSTKDTDLLVLPLDGTRRITGNAVRVPSEGWPGSPDTVTTEDVNRDGVADLLWVLRTSYDTFSEQPVYSVRYFASTGGKAPFYREETRARMPLNFSDPDPTNPREGARSEYQKQPTQPFTLSSADFDKDGDLDIYVGGEVSGSRYYRNDAGIWFDVTHEAGIGRSSAGMGTRVADFNDDGNLDLLSTENSYNSAVCPYSSTGCEETETTGNLLFLGNGKGYFTDAARSYGVARTGFSWGFSSTDLDSDGYPDFVIGTGEVTDEKADVTWEGSFSKPFLLRGGPDGWVNDSEPLLRAIDLPGTSVVVGSADFDGDLRPDILMMGRESSAPVLLMNRTSGGKSGSLLVKGRGAGGSPLMGESAKVRLSVPGRPRQTFLVPGHLSNYKLQIVGVPIPIGFGDADTAEVEVTFPSGRVVREIIRAGTVNVVTEPES